MGRGMVAKAQTPSRECGPGPRELYGSQTPASPSITTTAPCWGSLCGGCAFPEKAVGARAFSRRRLNWYRRNTGPNTSRNFSRTRGTPAGGCHPFFRWRRLATNEFFDESCPTGKKTPQRKTNATQQLCLLSPLFCSAPSRPPTPSRCSPLPPIFLNVRKERRDAASRYSVLGKCGRGRKPGEFDDWELKISRNSGKKWGAMGAEMWKSSEKSWRGWAAA